MEYDEFQNQNCDGSIRRPFDRLSFRPALNAYGASETKYSDYPESSAYKESSEEIVLRGGDYSASQSSAFVRSGSYLGEDNVLILVSLDVEINPRFYRGKKSERSDNRKGELNASRMFLV